MEKQTSRNIQLGLFVVLGLGAIITLLYLIGINQNLFGKNFTLEASFRDVSGLRVGNNVRFSGIVIGTVKRIQIVSDTSIQVVMKIDDQLVHVLKQNDIATIGTDGLMGNKVVDIDPGPSGGSPVSQGDIIQTREALDMDQMMRTLDITNRNVAAMSEDLKQTVQRINRSVALWEVLNDTDLPGYVKQSLQNVRSATAQANTMVGEVRTMVEDIASADQGVVALLKDSTLMQDLHVASAKLREVAIQTDTLARLLKSTVRSVDQDLNTGGGPLGAVLRDTAMTRSIDRSLKQLEEGTAGFNRTMDALRYHWLFRKAFKKQEKAAKQ